MDYGQEDIKRRLEAFQKDNGNGFAVSIKLRVPHCFCREHHAPVANRLIDDYRRDHPLDPRRCQYVEHESGPEVLVYLLAGLGLAREGISLVKSAIELVTAIVKARSQGREMGDEQHGPLVVVVRGLAPEGEFYEKQVLEVAPESIPTEDTIDTSLMDAIRLIAEERCR